MDWDDAYSNAAYIPDADRFPDLWAMRARDFRQTMAESGRAKLDVAYGGEPRERLDLFLPDTTPRGLFIFVHGGYWQRFDKSSWSHLAKGAVDNGWMAALPSYTLAPDARVSQITRQVARALALAASECSGPIHLAGHSAGGHLVSRMICRNGPLDRQTAVRIEHVTSISGLHDLRPLMKTTMNGALNLDLPEARAESAALCEPIDGPSLTCWVGSDERPEFVRQNDLLANIWSGLGTKCRAVHANGENHFTVIAALEQRKSDLVRACLKSTE